MIFAAAGAIAAAGPSVNPGMFWTVGGANLLVDGGTRVIGSVGGGPGLEPYRPRLVGAARSETGQFGRLSRGKQLADERVIREIERANTERLARQAQDAAREAAARAARDAAARRPLFVAPAAGRLTSAYGPRWATMHWGIDIANRIGTPIVSAADGVVVDAGPASGFGLWVRVRHADATVTVYGHLDRTRVRQGQAVKAGQQIATMGNRGDSTGPHLHFEVWSGSGSKINPLTWLRSRGVRI